MAIDGVGPLALRPTVVDDAAAVAAIYNRYIRDGVISFEESPLADAVMAERITRIGATHPWLSAWVGDCLVGYAYAATLRERSAYRWSVETTIYLDAEYHRCGIGRRLYAALLDCLRDQGFVTAWAAIALPNPGSVALHTACGFQPCGVWPAVGRKLGRWIDVGWYRCPLAATGATPDEPCQPDPALIERRCAEG